MSYPYYFNSNPRWDILKAAYDANDLAYKTIHNELDKQASILREIMKGETAAALASVKWTYSLETVEFAPEQSPDDKQTWYWIKKTSDIDAIPGENWDKVRGSLLFTFINDVLLFVGGSSFNKVPRRGKAEGMSDGAWALPSKEIYQGKHMPEWARKFAEGIIPEEFLF